MRGKGGGSLGLLQDTQLIETLAHFSRERIPERCAYRSTSESTSQYILLLTQLN